MAPSARPILWNNVAFIVLLPLLAIPAAVVYVAQHGVTAWELGVGLLGWAISGLGITAGYHRLFAHRAWKAAAPVRIALAIAGGMAAQNSVIAWASDHRRHHRGTDTDADPYNAHEGLWYSHVGWILREGVAGDVYDDVPDLHADRFLRFQHRHWFAVCVLGNLALLAPFAWLSGRPGGVLLLAGVIRVILVQHCTFTINSLSHWWGTQPWSHATTSRDNPLLALLTFGEGFHNYHHTFQADYRNGIRWYHWDPTKWLIGTLHAAGLASDLRTTPEHLLLRTRFERARSLLDARTATSAAQAMRADAEARVEAALTELRARTHVMAEARRARVAAANADARRHLAELQRGIDEGARAARDAIRAWERACRPLGRVASA
jgi:stearoyl-CoA desaturase (delta-9 desaturase)